MLEAGECIMSLNFQEHHLLHLTLSIVLSSIPISGERSGRVAHICCVLLVDKDKLSLQAVRTKEERFKIIKDVVV